MPFINTKVNVEITKEKAEILKSKFGKAIELIPGKSESGLMMSFEDKCNLYFRGTNDSGIAFVEVKIFGTSTDEAFNNLTGAIIDILNQELNISPTQIYVKYEEITHWGSNSRR